MGNSKYHNAFTLKVKQFKRASWPWIFRHPNPSKPEDVHVFTEWHATASQRIIHSAAPLSKIQSSQFSSKNGTFLIYNISVLCVCNTFSKTIRHNIFPTYFYCGFNIIIRLNSDLGRRKPTRRYTMFYWTCNLFNMFRAHLGPSPGARDYIASMACCVWFLVAGGRKVSAG